MAASIPRDGIARAVRAAFGPLAQVVGLDPLTGDASNRRYVRVRLTGAGPATAVAMLLAEGRFAGGADELGAAAAASELPFVTVARYLARQGLRTPTIYCDASRDTGLLLLEDIGDTTLWAAASASRDRAPVLFADAVDLLVQLQVAGATDPDTTCPAFARRFDAALARAEVEHFVEHGIETRHGLRLSAQDRAAVVAAFEPVVAPFASGPTALSHRDYMAWNLHLCGGELVIIDFQDALIAPDAFDLAQLLTDRTTVEVIGPSDERALIDRFVAARAAAGLPVMPGFVDRYQRCVLQHALKVIGRFHLLELGRKKPGYLAYLPAVYRVARRALTALPECASGVTLVARWVPELVEGAS